MNRTFFKFIISIIIFLNFPFALAGEFNLTDEKVSKGDNYKKNSNITKDINQPQYVLGPGDTLQIDFLGLSELSGIFIVGLDGYINLIDVGQVKASNFSLEELEIYLEERFQEFVKKPSISINIVEYKPIKVFVGGEVKKPGLYDFNIELGTSNAKAGNPLALPTLYDAIKEAGGITQFSDFSKVKVIRPSSLNSGGDTFETTINLFELFLKGDQSLNIPLFDKDTIIVGKSEKILKEQFSLIANSNLEPNTIAVFVSGNVQNAGLLEMPNNSSLTQAIAIAGGVKNLSGNIKFLRFDKNGKLEKRTFYHKYSQETDINSYKNPRLISGDIIHIEKSFVGKSAEFVGTLSPPIVNAYGIYKIFGGD